MDVADDGSAISCCAEAFEQKGSFAFCGCAAYREKQIHFGVQHVASRVGPGECVIVNIPACVPNGNKQRLYPVCIRIARQRKSHLVASGGQRQNLRDGAWGATVQVDACSASDRSLKIASDYIDAAAQTR